MSASYNRLLYQGHGSLKFTTSEGKVIYVDPYAGKGYDDAADLILITHAHQDHTAVKKIARRAPGCQVITWKEALEGGAHKSFDLGFVRIEAVEAGYNRNHDVKNCVGFVLTFSDGVKVYVSGDTSKTPGMAKLSEKKIDYALYCCDGIYNMDIPEASECARTVGAKHDIPYHMAPGKLFDFKRAEKFLSPNRLIVSDGEEIELKAE
ncbi:MAG: MBL fold metallo-hydrolase [Clostridia bacterium]|nr:MBL fold metallo-hydrolase [Clostridia bacterium]